MMFLIAKMFIYLLLAGGIGLAAGWLLRNLQAMQSQEKVQRAMHDAKSKLPQLESLLRGRDEQIVRLKNEIKERRQEHKAVAQQVKELEAALQAQQRETARWQQSAEAKAEFNVLDDDAGTDDMIAELSQEIAQLKAALAQAQSGGGTEQAVAASAPADNQAQELLAAELDAARLQVQQLEQNIANTRSDLARQRNTVAELERERELQNKSLQVLHQQLELERSNRLANC